MRRSVSQLVACEKEMHLHFSTTMFHPIHFIASVFRINELVHSFQSNVII